MKIDYSDKDNSTIYYSPKESFFSRFQMVDLIVPSIAIAERAKEHDIQLVFIETGAPTQKNSCVARFD